MAPLKTFISYEYEIFFINIMLQLTNVDYSINPIIPPFKPKSHVIELAMVEADLKHARKQKHIMT
jgi:hypothetical protein